jgi:hypothetical protein
MSGSELDPKYGEHTWKVLEHTINEICNHNTSGLSSEKVYMSVLQSSPIPIQSALS